MVLLPEDTSMTLAELRQMAARQQHQIEAQQQLLVAKEQRLKFLKQQEARHHSESGLDASCLEGLRGRVDAQEAKLRQLRALRGQVEQQRTNNGNLGTELDSIRALFSEKEKELNLAVTKVEELTRQLEEARNVKNRKNALMSPAALELEKLKRKLLHQTKLSEQQNDYICRQRESIAQCQRNIADLDSKIGDLTQRLHRKRLLNEQLAAQIRNTSPLGNKNRIYHSANVVAVEPLPREVPESQDDISARLQRDLGEFRSTKSDPKYQTLPYNTKFTLKGKLEDNSSTEEDSSPNSLESNSGNAKTSLPPLSVVKPTIVTQNRFVQGEDKSKAPSEQVGSKEDKSYSEVTDEISFSPTSKEAKTENLKVADPTKISSLNADRQNLLKTGKVVQEKSLGCIKPVITRSKPVVPPKPAFPVKPMVARHAQQNAAKSSATSPEEKDAVSAALSVLQKKPSDNDQIVIDRRAVKYPSHKESPTQEVPSVTSKLATYFQKTILQSPDSSSKSPEFSDLSRKKPVTGTLPIKPRPLTIRKTPGLEPPKLKVQPVVNLIANRKQENIYSTPSSQKLVDPSLDVIDFQSSEAAKDVIIPVVEVTPLQRVIDDQKRNGLWPVGQNEEERDETDLARDDVFLLTNAADSSSEISINDELEALVSPALRKMLKGSLKGENSLRRCRRVSFDPLALLLDAALEGELELVKKTIKEVPNPSAANDEGITALHNAICAGHTEVVTFLVEIGCDVNAQDSDGWTPLHCAASCNNLSMVKFLIECGACIFATTFSDHETAAEKCDEDTPGFEGCSEYLYSLQDNLGVSNGGTVYAVYDYEAQNPDELGFHDGDSVSVLRKGDDNESEWWWSRMLDREGYVPRNLLGLYPRVTSKKEHTSSTSSE